MAKIDDQAAKIIQKLESGKELTDKDRLRLCKFVSVMWRRTPKHQDHVNKLTAVDLLPRVFEPFDELGDRLSPEVRAEVERIRMEYTKKLPDFLFAHSAGWYSVRYPAEWRAEESEDLVTLYKAETGVGALQISAFQTPGHQDTQKVLFEYLSDKDLPINIASIIVQNEGSKEVSTYNYVEGDWYRHVWVISQGSHLLFVTYNSKGADKGKELNSILNIVGSVMIDS